MWINVGIHSSYCFDQCDIPRGLEAEPGSDVWCLYSGSGTVDVDWCCALVVERGDEGVGRVAMMMVLCVRNRTDDEDRLASEWFTTYFWRNVFSPKRPKPESKMNYNRDFGKCWKRVQRLPKFASDVKIYTLHKLSNNLPFGRASVLTKTGHLWLPFWPIWHNQLPQHPLSAPSGSHLNPSYPKSARTLLGPSHLWFLVPHRWRTRKRQRTDRVQWKSPEWHWWIKLTMATTWCVVIAHRISIHRQHEMFRWFGF